jgi:hypothetical protein
MSQMDHLEDFVVRSAAESLPATTPHVLRIVFELLRTAWPVPSPAFDAVACSGTIELAISSTWTGLGLIFVVSLLPDRTCADAPM